MRRIFTLISQSFTLKWVRADMSNLSKLASTDEKYYSRNNKKERGENTFFPIIIHDSRASQKARTHEVTMFPRIWKMRLRVARVRTPTASSRPILGDPTFAFLRCGLGTSLGSTSSCSFHIFYDATKELLRPQFILGTVSQKSSQFWSIFESPKGRKMPFLHAFFTQTLEW